MPALAAALFFWTLLTSGPSDGRQFQFLRFLRSHIAQADAQVCRAIIQDEDLRCFGRFRRLGRFRRFLSVGDSSPGHQQRDGHRQS